MPDTLDTLRAVLARVPAGYTPGPWIAGRNGLIKMVVSHDQTRQDGSRWQMRADIGTHGGVNNEESDAALIALAPESAAALAAAVKGA